MRIELSRPASGQEIVDAFKEAAALQESSSRRWGAYEFSISETRYDHDSGSIKQVATHVGVHVLPLAFEKRWIFFGKRSWSRDIHYNARFTLEPLRLQERYVTISVVAEQRPWAEPPYSDAKYVLNPFGLEPRVPLEKMLRALFDHPKLQPQPA